MIGDMIRKTRQEKKMTIADLAERAGVSTSFISQVERGASEPSLGTLRRIADALSVSLFSLVPVRDEKDPVVRREVRKKVVLPRSNVMYELLSPTVDRKLEMMMGRLPPRGVSSEEPCTHQCEECTIVLQGELEYVVGDQSYLLREGDSIYIDGAIPHLLRNVGDVEVVYISASTPPVF
ncbi:MAG: helix-turn-helix domain-containing protein [Ignavibacteriales bacterium]